MRNKTFFEVIKAFLPRTNVFDLTSQKNLRYFFEGLSALPDDVRDEMDAVLLDYYPETTRVLEKWEEAFRIQFSKLLFSVEERRSIVSALWWLRYGNTTREFMEKILNLFIPGALVTENIPAVNAMGLVFSYRAVCGNKYICCGNKKAFCNYHIGEREWVPAILRNDTQSVWDIPSDTKFYENYFFVSGEVWREGSGKIQVLKRLKVHEKWQRFVEYVILALKPVHTTAILFIEYVPNDYEIINE